MTVTELNAEITRLERLLSSGLSDVILVAGNSMCAEIANRVINTGKSDTGAQFTPYSTKPVPAYLYKGKSRNAAGEAKVQRAIKSRTPLSYRDFREANNLPGAPKNFSFNNDMWSHFGAKGVKGAGGKYVLTIGGTTTDAQNKIEWLSDQEGKSIIAPSAQELVALKAKIVRALN
jgi:hypothetical protein